MVYLTRTLLSSLGLLTISVDAVEDFRTVPVIPHGLEFLDVVVPDQGAREQRGELRVAQRVPDNLVLGMGCSTTEGRSCEDLQAGRRLSMS